MRVFLRKSGHLDNYMLYEKVASNHTAENGGRGGDLGGDSFNVNSSYLLPKNVFHPWCISASLEALRAPSWCHKVPKSGLSINSTSLSQGSSDDKSQH